MVKMCPSIENERNAASAKVGTRRSLTSRRGTALKCDPFEFRSNSGRSVTRNIQPVHDLLAYTQVSRRSLGHVIEGEYYLRKRCKRERETLTVTPIGPRSFRFLRWESVSSCLTTTQVAVSTR